MPTDGAGGVAGASLILPGVGVTVTGASGDGGVVTSGGGVTSCSTGAGPGPAVAALTAVSEVGEPAKAVVAGSGVAETSSCATAGAGTGAKMAPSGAGAGGMNSEAAVLGTSGRREGAAAGELGVGGDAEAVSLASASRCCNAPA